MASSATQTFPCLEGIFTKPKGFCFAVFACISCFICCERLETFGPSKSMCRSMGFGLLGLAFLAPYNLKQLIDQVASLACSKSAAGAAGSSAFPCCGTARRTFVQVPATSLQSLERFGCGKKREREIPLDVTVVPGEIGKGWVAEQLFSFQNEGRPPSFVCTQVFLTMLCSRMSHVCTWCCMLTMRRGSCVGLRAMRSERKQPP